MRLLAWFFDHLPFLACYGLGIALGVHHRTELAVLFFVFGSVTEIAGQVSELRRDVKALKAAQDAGS